MSAAVFNAIYELLGRKYEGRASLALPGVNCALGTTRGLQREQNEDRTIIVRGTAADVPFLLLAVSDGMGGMLNGAECARRTLSTLIGCFLTAQSPTILPIRLLNAVEKANADVFAEFEGKGGATLSVVVVSKSGAAWAANVGDSRIYSFDQQELDLARLSDDDTIEAQVAKLENREPDPVPSFMGGRLIQFIGVGSSMEPHIFEVTDQLKRGLLLTSDGVHRLSPETLRGVASHASSAKELVLRLLTVADWSGGWDNASAACVFPDAVEMFMGAKGERSSIATLWTPMGQVDIVAVPAGPEPSKPSLPVARKERNETKPPQNKQAGKKRSVARKLKRLREEDAAFIETAKDDASQISIKFVRGEGDE